MFSRLYFEYKLLGTVQDLNNMSIKFYIFKCFSGKWLKNTKIMSGSLISLGEGNLKKKKIF